MNQPKPFARTAAEAEQELRPMLEAHAGRLGGSLLEFWPAEPCVHQVRSSDHKWSEAWYGVQYKMPGIRHWAIDSDLIDLTLVEVLPLDEYSVRARFEVSVVVSEDG